MVVAGEQSRYSPQRCSISSRASGKLGFILVATLIGACVSAVLLSPPEDSWPHHSSHRFRFCSWCCSSCLLKKSFRLMINWTYLIVFTTIAYFILTPSDDDDDRDGGMMVPSYQRTGSWLVHFSSFSLLLPWLGQWNWPGPLNITNANGTLLKEKHRHPTDWEEDRTRFK